MYNGMSETNEKSTPMISPFHPSWSISPEKTGKIPNGVFKNASRVPTFFSTINLPVNTCFGLDLA